MEALWNPLKDSVTVVPPNGRTEDAAFPGHVCAVTVRRYTLSSVGRGAELTVVHYRWALGGGSSKAFVYDITRLIGRLATYPVIRPLVRLRVLVRGRSLARNN